MARSPYLKRWCFLVAVFCFSTSPSKSDAAADIVGSALTCFSNHYVYSSCQDSYRLGAEGNINVRPEDTDEYCNGPCLHETNLVLHCINGILDNFRFYNGASVSDVRYALNRGCGHTHGRGDFNALDHSEEYAYGDFYDHGNKLAIPIHLLVFLTCALLLWGY
ncbi:uncharacterized protein [Typha angustifolia]|uniref:uncharacterized protein n=1 Tax=Typha angustifolia TaxID=59011 RepID=UPI003C2C60F3